MRVRQSAAITAALVIAWSFVVASQEVDLGIVDRIKGEAFARSRVMEHLRMLTDVHGPRLTGTQAHGAWKGPIIRPRRARYRTKVGMVADRARRM